MPLLHRPGKGPDPAQKQLRQNKKRLSKEISHFTHTLTKLKDGINGRGSTELGISPSRIQDPLPTEIGSTLSQLAAEFQKIVGETNSVISEQASYSQRRRKKQPKKPKQMQLQQESSNDQSTVPPQDQVVQQLSQLAFEQYLIKKQATNRLTRSLQYLKSLLPFREQFNRERVGLLSLAASLFYSILDLENEILVLGISNMPAADSKYRSVHYHIDNFKQSLGQVLELLNEKKQEPGANSTQNRGKDEEQEFIGQFRELVSRIMNAFGFSNELTNFNAELDKFINEDDVLMKEELKNVIMKKWETWISNLKKQKGSQKVDDVLQRKTYSEINLLAKYAHNPISRFLRRQLVKSLKANKTALPRLKIVESLDKLKLSLRKVMDSLETNLDQKLLMEELNSILNEFMKIKAPLNILNTMHREKFYAEQRKKNKGQSDDALQEWLLTRKLRQEVRQDLF